MISYITKRVLHMGLLKTEQCYRHNTFTTILSWHVLISYHLYPPSTSIYILPITAWHLNIVVKLLVLCS